MDIHLKDGQQIKMRKKQHINHQEHIMKIKMLNYMQYGGRTEARLMVYIIILILVD